MNRTAFSVYEVNRYIKNMLETDVLLNGIYVEAEISNFKRHSSGHLYFTLKDDNAAINCVMFKSDAYSLVFKPESGMKVIVYGRVSLYEKTGQYQLYIETMEPYGKGSLYIAFEQLKVKLYKEGLFQDIHKQKIKTYPNIVAVITSKTGAAVQDIINVIKRRNKSTEIVIYPVLVQGEKASADIVQAIKDVNLWGKADTIILGRGGGSIEDLWAFNEEIVARAVFKSKIPIISAIGHETDYTITDFVSDLRAPTPSAAAELAVPNLSDVQDYVIHLKDSLSKSLSYKIECKKEKLEKICSSRSLTHPLENIYKQQIYLSQLNNRLYKQLNYKIAKNKTELVNKINILEKVSPLNILKKGYTVIYDEEKNVITTKNKLHRNQKIEIMFCDGKVDATVTDEGN